MKLHYALFLSLPILFSAAFAAEEQEFDPDSVCSGLKSLDLLFYDFDLTNGLYMRNNVSEYTLDYLNYLLNSSDKLREAAALMDGASLSLNIYNDNEQCFIGSIVFKDSQFYAIFDDVYDNAGNSSNNIYVYIDLQAIDDLLPYLKEKPEGSLFDKIGYYYNFGKTLFSYWMNGKISVKPLGSVFKLADFVSTIRQVDLSSLSDNLADYSMEDYEYYDVEDLEDYMDEYNITYDDLEDYLDDEELNLSI